MPVMTVISLVMNNRNHGHHGSMKYKSFLGAFLGVLKHHGATITNDDDFSWILREES